MMEEEAHMAAYHLTKRVDELERKCGNKDQREVKTMNRQDKSKKVVQSCVVAHTTLRV